MATYAIGDVQGCFAALQRLLVRVGFDARRDTIWLAGDLVNRGPDSLGVLRWARDMGERVVAVLGNHDLRLLSVYHGAKSLRPSDTLTAVLDAPDVDELIVWLQTRPLAHRADTFLLLHAGVVPSWTSEDTLARAREVQDILSSSQVAAFLQYQSELRADRWSAELTGFERASLITKILTYLRVCDAQDRVFLDFTGTPDNAPAGFAPWFSWPRRSADATIVCGHWSALGLHTRDNILALDTGCVWRGALTAVRLEDRRIYQEPAVPVT